MKKVNIIALLYSAVLTVAVSSCGSNEQNESTKENKEVQNEVIYNEAEALFKKCYQAHGGDLYEHAKYVFEFRGAEFTFKNDGVNYYYTKTVIDSVGNIISDEMSNEQELIRTINGTEQDLSEKAKKEFSSSLNSVIYFATLPHKLNDQSVNKAYLGSQGEYELLGIKFNEKGGGKDHDDHYVYWINSETGQIDYFAYDYQVNGGGVRFRSAFNTRNIDGILFQDYINYEAPIGTNLENLLEMYERGELSKLSEILTENVLVL